MSKHTRESLIPNTREIEGKVNDELKISKDISWNYKASDLSVESMSKDKFVETFVSMKNDCIALQVSYREIILHLNSGIGKSAKQFKNSNHADPQLLEFEAKYNNMNLNVPLKERLDMLIELFETREKLLAKMNVNLLEQQLGLDFMVRQETDGHPIFSLCSKEIIDLLSLMRTFQVIAYKLQKVQLSNEANEVASMISTQQQQIAVLDQELHASVDEYTALKRKYDNIMSEQGKQQTLARLQIQIDALEKNDREMSKEITRLKNLNQELTLSNSFLKDQLTISLSKFNDLKKLYDKNINDMEPVIQKNYNHSMENMKTLDLIKNDISVNMGRFKLSERQFEEAQEELIELRKIVTNLTQDLNDERKNNKILIKENQNKMKLCMVAVAAKMTSNEEIKILERSLGKNKIASNRLLKLNNEYKSEIGETEEYVGQLQKIIEDSNKIHQELERQIQMKNAEIAALEISEKELKEKYDTLQEVGLSAEKQVEWNEREETIARLNARITKLMVQSRKYASRVDELEQQVIVLETELNS